jgi:hypothetical protein
LSADDVVDRALAYPPIERRRLDLIALGVWSRLTALGGDSSANSPSWVAPTAMSSPELAVVYGGVPYRLAEDSWSSRTMVT